MKSGDRGAVLKKGLLTSRCSNGQKAVCASDATAAVTYGRLRVMRRTYSKAGFLNSSIVASSLYGYFSPMRRLMGEFSYDPKIGPSTVRPQLPSTDTSTFAICWSDSVESASTSIPCLGGLVKPIVTSVVAQPALESADTIWSPMATISAVPSVMTMLTRWPLNRPSSRAIRVICSAVKDLGASICDNESRTWAIDPCNVFSYRACSASISECPSTSKKPPTAAESATHVLTSSRSSLMRLCTGVSVTNRRSSRDAATKITSAATT